MHCKLLLGISIVLSITGLTYIYNSDDTIDTIEKTDNELIKNSRQHILNLLDDTEPKKTNKVNKRKNIIETLKNLKPINRINKHLNKLKDRFK
jgi:arabinogalactan endo-1,4-beta-galactosidase